MLTATPTPTKLVSNNPAKVAAASPTATSMLTTAVPSSSPSPTATR
jgi:hypothetical protein